MNIPYKRPYSFSNPSRDFSNDELKKIIETEDSALSSYEFHCIYQQYLPAGNYCECAYFIPHVLDFIRQGNDGAASVLSNFIGWCNSNSVALHEDGILIQIINIFHEYFSFWVSDFIIMKNGDGYMFPKYGSEVDILISELNESKNVSNGDVLVEKMLLPATTYTKAAWFFWLFEHGNHSLSMLLSALGDNRCFNEDIYAIVLEKVCTSSDSVLVEYWNERFKWLF